MSFTSVGFEKSNPAHCDLLRAGLVAAGIYPDGDGLAFADFGDPERVRPVLPDEGIGGVGDVKLDVEAYSCCGLACAADFGASDSGVGAATAATFIGTGLAVTFPVHSEAAPFGTGFSW